MSGHNLLAKVKRKFTVLSDDLNKAIDWFDAEMKKNHQEIENLNTVNADLKTSLIAAISFKNKINNFIN